MSENGADASSKTPTRQGNSNLITLRSIYDSWNIAWRGNRPHGIRTPPVYEPDDFEVPETFEETDDSADIVYPDGTPFTSVQDIVPIPVVIAGNITPEKPRDGAFCTFYTENVQALTTQRLVIPQRYRTEVILLNQGPGIVYLAQDESVGRTGYPLMPTNTGGAALTAGDPLHLRTTRDIWAIQQTAQTSNALVSIILQYDRSLD